MSHRAVVPTLGIVQIFAWGGSYYLMAVLSEAIVADMGWPLPWVVGAVSVALGSAGLASPLVGRMIARHGGRPVLGTGCAIMAAGLVVIAAARHLAVFHLGWAVLGIGMAAGLYDPVFATLGRLYGQQARRAITTLTLWGGFASTVCWPLSVWLLGQFGWRGTMLTYAAILLAAVPAILTLIPREPKAPPRPAIHGEASVDPVTFLLMAAILVLAGLAFTTIAIHLVTLLGAQGLSVAEAVAIGTLLGPAQVAARVVEMASGGRHHPIRTMTMATGCTAGGLVLLALDAGLPAAAIVIYGAGAGIFSIARGALPLALFGAEAYPAVMGRLARPSMLAQAAAPLLAALLFAGIGPASALWVIAGLGVITLTLALVLMGRIRRGKT